MSIPKAVSPSVLTPGVYMTVDLLAGVSAPGVGVLRVALLCPKSAAGDLTNDTEVRLGAGEASASTAFGIGAPGHLAAKQLYAEYPQAQVDFVAPAPGSTAADLDVTALEGNTSIVAQAGQCVSLGSGAAPATAPKGAPRIALAGAEVGMVFCTLTLASGPIWAKGTWGHWWAWDPRLSVTLLLWFIYAAYLLLRSFTEGSERTARFAAVYGLVGTLAMPLNYYAIDLLGGAAMHPENLERGSLGSGMRLPFALSALTRATSSSREIRTSSKSSSRVSSSCSRL